jgi:hypothetical protein
LHSVLDGLEFFRFFIDGPVVQNGHHVIGHFLQFEFAETFGLANGAGQGRLVLATGRWVFAAAVVVHQGQTLRTVLTREELVDNARGLVVFDDSFILGYGGRILTLTVDTGQVTIRNTFIDVDQCRRRISHYNDN